jgi:aminoglycoside phosphotransferase (APT) family kinase protein
MVGPTDGSSSTAESVRALIERVLDKPVARMRRAAWGFTNRTDIVTLAGGESVVLQRYRRRADADRRLRITRALQAPAAAAGIALARELASDLDAEPSWVIFEALPGVPVPDLGAAGLEDPRFPELARAMGDLLARFRELSPAGISIDDLWASPDRLATEAAAWSAAVDGLAAPGRSALDALIDTVPTLFARRPAVLAHGDFAPVNVLTDGTTLTGLLDLEWVRLADPLFDVAWWAWAVRFAGAGVFEAAWPAFLEAARVQTGDPDLPDRIRALQVLRMLELLAGSSLAPEVRPTVAASLRSSLE